MLESERTTEKLSFVGLVEQLKAQVFGLENALEQKAQENKQLVGWNKEKAQEIEVMRQKTVELEEILERFKALGEDKDLAEAVVKAGKEKTMLEAQIRTLRTTIENQKGQIEKLFEKLREKGEQVVENL